MGIRFHCPECQDRLHVKSFLAGKRAVCPKCGAKLQIPSESELPDDEKEADAPATQHEVSHIESAVEQHTARTGTVTLPAKTLPAKTLPAKAAPTKATPTKTAASNAATTNTATNTATTNTSPANTSPALAMPLLPTKSRPRTNGESYTPPVADPNPAVRSSHVGDRGADPLTESPQHVWYVRPPSGGQFGPAKGDVMQRWISEGRVTHDSLVWREGWPEWRIASEVLPSVHVPAATEASASVVQPPTLPTFPAGAPKILPAPAIPAAAAASVMRYQKKKRERRGIWTAAVVVLSILAVALIVMLIFVLRRTP